MVKIQMLLGKWRAENFVSLLVPIFVIFFSYKSSDSVKEESFVS